MGAKIKQISSSSDCKSENNNGGGCSRGRGGLGLGPQVGGQAGEETTHHQVEQDSIKQMFRLLMATTVVRVGAVERPDREVGRLLAESRGTYCHLLGGWLVGFQWCHRAHYHAHNFSWDTKLWSYHLFPWALRFAQCAQFGKYHH